MSLGGEVVKEMKWKGGVERVEAKEKVLTCFFSFGRPERCRATREKMKSWRGLGR